MRVIPVSEIESMPLVHCFHTGNWANPYAELFAPTDSEEVTHLHVYNRNLAVKAFLGGHMPIPKSVVTVSYAEGN